jgi:hypothetical protein
VCVWPSRLSSVAPRKAGREIQPRDGRHHVQNDSRAIVGQVLRGTANTVGEADLAELGP